MGVKSAFLNGDLKEVYVAQLPGFVDDDNKHKVFRLRKALYGLLSYYLGIEVSQGADGIKLCQAAYAGKLLEHTGLSACNPSLAPMEPRLKLSKRSTRSPVNATEYRRAIGELRYLLHTRPNLAFVVGYLSRFMEQPAEEHLTGVKRVLRYLAGTRDHGLHYVRHEEGRPRLIGFLRGRVHRGGDDGLPRRPASSALS
jgi:hypothetical protein